MALEVTILLLSLIMYIISALLHMYRIEDYNTIVHFVFMEKIKRFVACTVGNLFCMTALLDCFCSTDSYSGNEDCLLCAVIFHVS